MDEVIVIGAGLSGLAAAYEISKRKKVLVIEKEPRIGGRASVIKYQSHVLDASAQFIFDNFENLLNIAKETGCYDKIIPMGSENLALYKGKKFHSLNLAGLIKNTSISDKWNMLKLIAFLRKNDSELSFSNQKHGELDNQNFAEWFDSHFNKSLFDYFAQPICSSLSMMHPERIAASYGLSLLNSGIRKPIYSMDGGVGNLSLSLAEAIKANGGKIITSCEVTKIDSDGNSITGVECKDGYFKASKVVSSIPAPLFWKIFRKNKQPKGNVEYASCIHFWCGLDEKVITDSFAVVFPRIEWEDHLAIVNTRLKSETHVPAGSEMIELLIFEEHAKKLMNKSESAIQDKLSSDLSQLFNKNFDGKIKWSKISKIPYGMPVFKPKYYKDNSFYFSNELDGLFFCGDYMGKPSLEIAVLSGINAAKKVLSE